MDAFRYFDKILNQNVQVEDGCYPLIEKDNYVHMEKTVTLSDSAVICFPYFRYHQNKPYIDIYIWDDSLQERCKRFAFAENAILNEKEEKQFLSYCEKQIAIDECSLQLLVKKVNEELPKLHLIRYEDKRHILLHLYYTMHRSGVYEILYKANLDYLAGSLDAMDSYNLIGTSPQMIFDVQTGMLRSLNSAQGVEYLITPQNRQLAKSIYAKYHNLIRGRVLNRYQWKYLCGLIEEEQLPEKQMFDMLGKIESDAQYHTYLRYLEYREVVEGYYTLLPKFPDVGEIDERAEACSMIEWCIEHESGINYRLREKANRYRSTYEYESEDYVIRVPDCVDEFLKEAENQHNCFYQCIFDMAFDETVMLVMRDKRHPEKSLVTIEVDDDRINQAFQAFNSPLTERQRDFLEQFAEAKGLFICDDYDDYEYDDDFDDSDEYDGV